CSRKPIFADSTSGPAFVPIPSRDSPISMPQRSLRPPRAREPSVVQCLSDDSAPVAIPASQTSDDIRPAAVAPQRCPLPEPRRASNIGAARATGRERLNEKEREKEIHEERK